MTEILLIVEEAEEGGYVAHAVGASIVTAARSRRNSSAAECARIFTRATQDPPAKLHRKVNTPEV